MKRSQSKSARRARMPLSHNHYLGRAPDKSLGRISDRILDAATARQDIEHRTAKDPIAASTLRAVSSRFDTAVRQPLAAQVTRLVSALDSDALRNVYESSYRTVAAIGWRVPATAVVVLGSTVILGGVVYEATRAPQTNVASVNAASTIVETMPAKTQQISASALVAPEAPAPAAITPTITADEDGLDREERLKRVAEVRARQERIREMVERIKNAPAVEAD